MSRDYYEDDYGDRGDYRRRENIPNYLAQAILVTLFCCLPLGIVAIVYASQVNGKLAQGDIEGARRASEQAKTYSTLSLILGIVGAIIWGIVNFVVFSQMQNNPRF